MSDAIHATVRQEEDRVAGRRIVAIVVAALVLVGSGVVATGVLLGVQEGSLHGPRVPWPPRAGPTAGIVHQTPIDRDRYGLRLAATQRERLRRYGWVDRAAGVAHIPIERAMDLVVAHAPGPGRAAP